MQILICFAHIKITTYIWLAEKSGTPYDYGRPMELEGVDQTLVHFLQSKHNTLRERLIDEKIIDSDKTSE